jgi:hypothetical protein
MAINNEEPILSGPDHDLMRMIGELALDLHSNRSTELTSTLPPGSPEPSQLKTSDFLIQGNTVRFSSIEARNRCVAAYVFEKNRQPFANDTQKWINTANELWMHEISDNDSATGHLLA